MRSPGPTATLIATMSLVGLVTFGCSHPVKEVGPSPGNSISFSIADLSTGVWGATLTVYAEGRTVTLDVLKEVADQVRVFSWPSNASVVPTVTMGLGTSPDAGFPAIAGSGWIDVELDPANDAASWFGLTLAKLPEGHRFQAETALFAFAAGVRGVRFSPKHAPLIASLLACTKAGGALVVYVSFSELVSQSANAVSVSHGVPPVPCDRGGDATQFLCGVAPLGDSLSVEVSGLVTSVATGTAAPLGTLTGADLQSTPSEALCLRYEPQSP
jgi:hypothetical protein